MAALPFMIGAGALWPGRALAAGFYTGPYLDWMNRPHEGRLNELLQAVIGQRTIAYLLYDASNQVLIGAHLPELGLPVASAFKGPLAMYFFQTVPAYVWQGVPPQYWASTRADQVPTPYQAAWYDYGDILRALWRMMVISDNVSTGHVLAYVAYLLGSSTPLKAFNDWAHGEVGISQLSGLSNWYYGLRGSMEPTDLRYGGQTSIDGQLHRYANLYTVRDLGLFYLWFLESMAPDPQLACAALLNMTFEDRRSNLERLAEQNQGMAFSKNGNLGRDSSPAGIVITDAGLIQHGNGITYLAAMLAVNAEGQVPTLVNLTDQILKGGYDAFVYPSSPLAPAKDANSAYAAALSQNYATSPPRPNEYNYGFVRYSGISAYSAMDEAATVRNPVINSTRGVHLLMQGALIRFQALNDTWAQLIPDDAADNIRQRLGEPLYLKLADLLPIGDEYFSPIPYLLDSSLLPEQKMLVVDIGQRQLSLLEKDNVVFKSPVSLNTLSTPRGSYPVISQWACRSMQAWAPGVPFTTFFHVGGFALHGSPWQRWAESVTQANIVHRLSAGCINLPNWSLNLGFYERPVDELIFRWLGGAGAARQTSHEYPQSGYNQLRIFIVDRVEDLSRHTLPGPIAQNGATWERVQANIAYVPVSAPASFFT
jgi:hypothetical protein